MNFDHTIETITLDQSTVLTVNSTGALALPSGTTGQRVNGTGTVRWNTTSSQPEISTGGANWSNVLHSGLFTSTGDILIASAANTAARLGVGTNGQVLTSNGTTPTWSSVAGASYAATITPNTLVSGNKYYTDVTHSLGTQNIVVSMYDTATNAYVIPDSYVQLAGDPTNTLRVTVIGNSRTYRIVIVANGASIAAGGSTPSSIIVQNNGIVLSGGPFTTINLSPGLTAVNSGSGVATVAPTASIRTMSYFATSLDSPNNANWALNALAPAIADPANSALTVRQFSNTTEQGVGFLLPVPTGATNATFEYRGRAQTAQGASATLQMRVYTRSAGNNAAVSAWSSAINLTSVTVPANANFQYYSQTGTLASLGLAAGTLYQIELTRNTSVAGNLATQFLLAELTVSFS